MTTRTHNVGFSEPDDAAFAVSTRSDSTLMSWSPSVLEAADAAAVDAPTAGTAVRVDAQADADWRRDRSFTWVPNGQRPLPVRIDRPRSGWAVGAVVIVPSLGREAVVSYRTIRSLAVRAARAGYVALTFSLSGDGDSPDLALDEDAVESWLDDVRSVRDYARALVGDQVPVSLVGLRLGAALVGRLAAEEAEAPTSAATGASVVWEPVSGTSFLRHHTQLRASGVPGDPLGGVVELDGFVLTSSQAQSLRGLKAARRSQATTPGEHGLAHGQVYVRFEADRRASIRLALGATYFAHVPLDTLDEIIAALPAGGERPLANLGSQREATFNVVDAHGVTRQVTESLIEFGPLGLPAIITTSPNVAPTHGLVLSAMGAEVKWGPGRVWTRAARDLAPLGVVAMRADRSLIGDDVDPDNPREPHPYTDQSVNDVADAVTALRQLIDAPQAIPVALAGVCAGTWSGLRAAAERPIDVVVAVNPVHWNPDASLYTQEFYDHYHGEEAPELDNPSEGSVPTLGELRAHPGRALARCKGLLSREVAIRFPWVRSMLVPVVPVDRVRYLLDDVIGGTSVHLVLGTEEERIFNGKGGTRAMSRARRRGVTTTIERLGNLDHSLLSERARQDTLALLRRLLVEQD